jgi:hypothetical protein
MYYPVMYHFIKESEFRCQRICQILRRAKLMATTIKGLTVHFITLEKLHEYTSFSPH